MKTWPWVLSGTLLLLACGDDQIHSGQEDQDVPLQDAATEDVAPETTPSDVREDAPPDLPDTQEDTAIGPDADLLAPALRELQWFLEIINGAAPLTPELMQAHFTPAFIEQVPDLIRVLTQWRQQLSPMRLDRVISPPDDHYLEAAIAVREDLWFKLQLRTQSAPPHLISTLLLTRDAALNPDRPGSFAELTAQLPDLAPLHNFLAAEIVDGECEEIASAAPDTRLALASTFKLYVLAELAAQVASGQVHWDDELAIRDDWKSLPSGRLQLEPAGTLLTLEEMAGLMISISDNTGTDHLLRHLGREQVEARQMLAGHGAPERNIPFLTTRELFLFKGLATNAEIDAYLALSADEKRAYLEGPLADRDLSAVSAWGAPRYIETLEWFASANDLCRLLTSLRDTALTPEGAPVTTILTTNPGVNFGTEHWPVIGFKGGSEPGVLHLTWLLRRADQRWFVLTMALNHPDEDISQDDAISFALDAALILAQTP